MESSQGESTSRIPTEYLQGLCRSVWDGVQVYTNIRRFKEDLTQFPPHFFICVPLVLDTLYNRVRLCSEAGGLPSFVLAFWGVSVCLWWR